MVTPDLIKFVNKNNLKYKCEICGCLDKEALVLHHIRGQTSNANSNLIILCLNCHTKLHEGKLKLINKIRYTIREYFGIKL